MGFLEDTVEVRNILSAAMDEDSEGESPLVCLPCVAEDMLNLSCRTKIVYRDSQRLG